MHAKRIAFGSSSVRRLKQSRHASGSEAAFDYLVGEKLVNFVSAASGHPDFARELPRFVSEVRRTFTPDEIGTHLARIERAQSERDVDVLEEDDLLRENPAAIAQKIRQFSLIKELLAATTLGTS